MRKGFTLIELMIVIAIIAIIAAIAIPNLLESRVTANEAAASASLKSGVFPAQVQFQAGGNQDTDADNVGEYGTLRALAGLIATNKVASGSIKLLQGPLANSASYTGTAAAVPSTTINPAPMMGTMSGYKFVGYAGGETEADDDGATVWAEGDAAPTAILTSGNSSNNGEKYYVVGAAPEKYGDTGRRVFLICQDGQIRSPAKAVGAAAFYNATGAAPTNGNAVAVGGMIRGIAYGFTAAYTSGTAAATQVMANTTFDDGATLVYEVYAK